MITSLLAAALLGNAAVAVSTTSPAPQDSARTSTRTPATIVVTASRESVPLDRAPRTIDVVDRQMLERLPIRSLQEALQWLPGVDVRQRGPLGVQADLSIRGGGFEQTAVLLDGMRMNDMQTGHHSMNVPLLPEDIDRIEVVKGGASRLFGASALDGAVNIIPRTSGPDRVWASATGGDFGLYDLRLGSTVNTGAMHHRLSTQYLRADGDRPNTDARIEMLNYSGSLPMESGSVSLHGGVVSKTFGANGFYTPRFPTAWEHTVTWYAGISTRHVLDEAWSITARALYRINTDDFQLRREDPLFFRNLHRTDQATAQVITTHTSAAGRTSVSLEVGSDRIESTNLGNHDRIRGFATVDHVVDLTDDMLIGGGIGMMTFSDRLPIPVGGIDWSWRTAEGSRIYATVNRSGRIPTYTDLFYRDGTTEGNPNLTLEYSTTMEGGLVHMVGLDWTVTAAAYGRFATNVIDYAQNTETTFRAANIGNVDIAGIEASVRWMDPSAILLQTFRVSANWQDVQSTAPVLTRYSADHLRWQAVVETGWSLPLDLQATFLVRIIQRNGVIESRTLGNDDVRVIGDLRLWMQFDGFRLVGEVTNLWNTRWIESGWVVMPQRWGRLGIEVAAGS
jgi:iron complex outermembrane receptor protein